MLLFSLTISSVPSVEGISKITLDGFVHGSDGSPIQNASILLWGFTLEAETSTDQRGYYALEASTYEPNCKLYAFYDDLGTPRIDLLPSMKSLKTDLELQGRVNFTLVPAATVKIIGQIRPIESTRNIQKYAFEVVHPSNGSIIRVDGYELIYGTGMNVQSYFLGLDPKTIIVSAGTPFAIEVSSSYQYDRTRSRRRWYGWHRTMESVGTFNKFVMAEGEGFTLGSGQVLALDLRKYSLISDLVRVEKLRSEVEANITRLEEKGFYTASERHTFQRAKELIESSTAHLEEDLYDASYVDLREAYLKLVGIEGRLETVMLSASVSMDILVVFIALTSVALSTFLTEKGFSRLMLTAAFYVPLLLYLRQVYPGSGVVSQDRFIQVGLVSVSAVLLVMNVLPRLLRGGKMEGWISRLGALVAVFSLAKRNLKRRRLRSGFTFATLLTLTMSFVALTSLSTSYGLVYVPLSSKAPDMRGITMRMPVYKPHSVYQKGWFYPVIEAVADWAAGNYGVVNTALKAENAPRLRPYASVDDWPIFGIIGIQPDREPVMQSIDIAVVEGEPLRGDGTCLLHEYLLQYGAANLGDYITIRGVRLRVTGFFDSRVQDVKDLDGEAILPKYQVNLTPGEEQPMIEVFTCDAPMVAIMTLNNALEIDGVYPSRVDVELDPGVDAEVLGKSMALAREYRFWISDGGAIHMAYMGEQVGGKGLPLLVPWAIVVLNVVTTMMNSMYERRLEINILSSIGLNPAHISGVFLAEASILGVIAGGFGYLLGLGWYPLMAGLSMIPVVQQKVSAVWCLGAIGIAISSVVIGSAIALQGSVVLTPSLRRRWAIEGEAEGMQYLWEIPMPIKVEERHLADFTAFLRRTLEKYGNKNFVPYVYSLKMAAEELDGGRQWTISFIYIEGQSSLGGKKTSNTMTIWKDKGADVYSIVLESEGDKESVHSTGSFIRRMLMKWTTEQEPKRSINPGERK